MHLWQTPAVLMCCGASGVGYHPPLGTLPCFVPRATNAPSVLCLPIVLLLLPCGPFLCVCDLGSTLKAIRMEEGAKGRRLTAAERQELMSNPAKLVKTLLAPLGVLYSGLKPAAIETAASQAVSALGTGCLLTH